MKTKKVIIIVRGGLVESVHVSPSLPPIELTILDYDNLSQGDPFTEDELAAEGEIENKQVIEIY